MSREDLKLVFSIQLEPIATRVTHEDVSRVELPLDIHQSSWRHLRELYVSHTTIFYVTLAPPAHTRRVLAGIGVRFFVLFVH